MAGNIDWAGGGTRAKSILTRCTASCAVAVWREGEDLGLSLIHGREPLRLPPAERLGRCEQGSFSEAATGAAAVGAGRRTECEERGGSRGRATREAEGRRAGGLHSGEGRSSGVSVRHRRSTDVSLPNAAVWERGRAGVFSVRLWETKLENLCYCYSNPFSTTEFPGTSGKGKNTDMYEE